MGFDIATEYAQRLRDLQTRSKAGLINQNVLVTVAFLLIVPTLAHLLFSWRGFNPTDDGFTLAYGRRILDGQIPHRDFITIRPFLSPLLHTPFVLFGGEYTYWISRFFVWFQWACISWAWVCVINRAFGNPFNNTMKLFVGLMGFAASVHYGPIMAWHTTDGLFLSSIGLWMLVAQEHPSKKALGYSLIAAAYLCKQSFLFMAPLSILLLGDWREKKYWVTIILPGAAYCAFLLATGSFSEAILQLASQTGIVSVGVAPYLNSLGFLLGIAAGYGATFMFSSGSVPLLRGDRVIRYVGASILVIIPASFITYSLIVGNPFGTSFGVFGMVLGLVLYCVFSRTARDKDEIRIASIALLFAWSASLSIGYQVPLLLGSLLTTLMAFVYSGFGARELKLKQLTLVIAVIAILAGFGVARTNHIFREPPSSEITESLDGVLPGGKLIYTNPNTHAFLVDLNDAVDAIEARNKKYAIMPFFAGYWVQSRQPNPLPIDWHLGVELNNQHLIDRVVRDLEAQRGRTIVIVQKVEAAQLADGFVSLDEEHSFWETYPTVTYVRTHLEKTGETKFLELYE